MNLFIIFINYRDRFNNYPYNYSRQNSQRKMSCFTAFRNKEEKRMVSGIVKHFSLLLAFGFWLVEFLAFSFWSDDYLVDGDSFNFIFFSSEKFAWQLVGSLIDFVLFLYSIYYKCFFIFISFE